MYQLTNNPKIVKHIESGAFLPEGPAWGKYQAWLAEGNAPEPADPEQSPPTDDEIYDQTMENNKLIKALAISLNAAGAFSIDGEILTNSTLKTLVKSNM